MTIFPAASLFVWVPVGFVLAQVVIVLIVSFLR